MRRISLVILVAALLMVTACCGMAQNGGSAATTDDPSAEIGVEGEAMMDIDITVGSSTFAAKLYDTEAARAFIALFPLTLDMTELNGNEKYCNLAADLPSGSTERPSTIHAGEIICWSGNCLVLFYETFSNSFGGYIRLGYVQDASGFAAALGSGNVRASFSTSLFSSSSNAILNHPTFPSHFRLI